MARASESVNEADSKGRVAVLFAPWVRDSLVPVPVDMQVHVL
jgi:hypothetical protein